MRGLQFIVVLFVYFIQYGNEKAKIIVVFKCGLALFIRLTLKLFFCMKCLQEIIESSISVKTTNIVSVEVRKLNLLLE